MDSDLNSIFIEGKIASLPKNDRFTILNSLSRKTEEGIVTVSDTYNVVMPSTMTERLIKFFKKNHCVRVVGKLGKAGRSVVINAEYIEFKPYFLGK